MSGFRKAKAEQAALKIGLYGASGSGKTFTALLIAEGLAKKTGKRMAYVDTERGTDFYCQANPDRKIHPESFDFDSLYTKSITEVANAIESLDLKKYGVLVIDSITHIWEAAQLAYSGKETSVGTIPFHAWGKIKKPYKKLINFLIASPLHILICGRQGNDFDVDEESGELKKVGVKMKAEGETPYEPHVLIHMEAVKNPKTRESVITAYGEKDRTSLIAGKVIQWPNFENIAKPMLSLLGDKQAEIKSDEEVSRVDAEQLDEEEVGKKKSSERVKKQWIAQMIFSNSKKDLEEIAKKLTPVEKKKMTPSDLKEVKEEYINMSKSFK